MVAYNTLTELILARKDENSKGITFIFGDFEEQFVSYQELNLNALSVLYNLQAAGFKKGDEVIFQIEENRKFINCFWACILGGMIPVPITTGANDEHRMKLFKIWGILKNPKIIASKDFIVKLNSFAQKNNLSQEINFLKARTIYVEDIEEKLGCGDIFESNPEDLAFIQFSSGSTGDPKGVMITHKNVLVNLSSVIEWMKIDENDASLNWMPLTHDMGLIGIHIKEILANINQYNMQTQLFIRHPSLWIHKASEHRVTFLSSPNFGYKHFLKFLNTDTQRDWDLSKVRIIYNGAEPISIDLCNEFLDKLSVHGLNRKAMFPVYGLAEGTIAVTFPKLGESLNSVTINRQYLGLGQSIQEVDPNDIKGITFIDVGFPIHNCYLRICDGDDKELDENKIGYIQIRGGNVTKGYYNNPVSTKKNITEDGWLNTNDLGFLKNGRLIITGRAKDVIFISGQNYYSHDIERVAECVEGIELGKIAAVGTHNDKRQCDELILFVMFKQKVENFIPTIIKLKKVINQKFGIEVTEVIPIKNMPKTTSGKVQRYKLRDNYINGDFDAEIKEIHGLLEYKFDSREIELPKNAVEEELVNIWSDILGVSKIGTGDNFFDLGGDSLKLTQIISRIRETFNVNLEQGDIFENSEIKRLAALIEKEASKAYEHTKHIKCVSDEDSKHTLSFGQQRLWFLDRLNQDSAQYNLYAGFRFKGNFIREIFEKSLNIVANRHKILLASFDEDNGWPFQKINNGVKLYLPLIDLRGIEAGKRQAEALKLANEEASGAFNLQEAPLIRGKAIQIGESEHILVLVVHHIVFDGWSFGILMEELTECYNALIAGKEPLLKSLDIQYSDFSNWQQECLNTDTYKNQLEYWKNKLGGKIPSLDLPIDKQRPAVQTYNGKKFTTMLPENLISDLKSFAKRENTTLFMVLLSAFKVALYRYTGQEDIIIGSPIANRNRRETEKLIGFFTNNLVIRSGLKGIMSFSEVLKTVKKVTLEAYSNQDIPFEKLVEELHVERDMSRNPVFQVLFSLQNTHKPKLDFSELDVSQIELDCKFARFDIALDLREAGKAMAVDFEYNTDLFNTDTIIRLAGHYSQLLESALKEPEIAVNKLNMLTVEEKENLLIKWNNTKAYFGNIQSWTKLFEEQVLYRSDKMAVACGGESISYKELNIRGNKIAAYLKKLGIGPEKIVGIYLERSINMAAALLGVHKVGAAYMPMDPIFPKDRLSYMVEDSKAEIILSEKSLADTLPLNKAKVIYLDEAWEEIAACGSEKLEIQAEPKNLAYVIYTSGSTGKPKGVQIEQRALVNFLKSMAINTEISEKDVLLAVTTISFDIAGLELFLPLTVGASIVLARRDEVSDGERLSSMLKEYKISMMQATPATWRLLIESDWKGKKDLTVLCGGEALPRDLADQLLDRCKTLFNVYGPTETTIWSTMTKVETGSGQVSIGKPIANTEVYVLDSAMNPVPVGVPGELYIGGHGVARGYLNRPELTAEKFVENPFSSETRLYRTGDLVKFLPDANLEFVGRADNQVKIRGFRIELGEIEALLNQNNDVKESVVTVKEIIKGEKSLVAYIIPNGSEREQFLTSDNLRGYLKEKLPDYMIPSAFVLMKAYPMTPNGKIDRKALPMPEIVGSGRTDDYIPSTNEIENSIATIWQEVLKLGRVGVNDNFFDLGGHSLLLAQVRSKIGKVLKRDISMMDLFKYPTVGTLAKFIQGDREENIQNIKSADKNNKSNSSDIAIIGLSGRFPGARNIDEFWENLCQGKECITHFSDDEILEAGISSEAVKKPGYVKAWGTLEGVDKFDAAFFGYNPREAEILDPQQRVFLEESWKALENAGYDSEKYSGTIGVFASVGMNTYINNLHNQGDDGLARDYQVMISNDKDFLATRTAYKMNLEGPAMTVQTACSSSLVAVHLACQSLINDECSMALAGGVSIRLPQKTGYMYQEGMILSPDGHCRAFDKDSKGTVGGNGSGVVVLKRLEDSIADGDTISAVIKGTAINNDGALKIGYTAPRIDGQAKAIAKAQENAGINPESITYIEAHGTGTPLGDPIEIEALSQVLGKSTDKKGYCAIGSVKTNIGHLDAAAGVTGLIKAVLSLRNKKLLPSLNFKQQNSKIDFENSPFFVNTSLKEWKNDKYPLRAGVSSFGIGGTNAHAVLEEAPVLSENTTQAEKYLLIFSAKTESALKQIIVNFKDYLKDKENIGIADAAYTLQVGRRELEHRHYVICSSRIEAIEALENNTLNSIKNIQNTISIFNEADLTKYTLEELGEFWVNGGKINWSKLYEGKKVRHIPLPVYPFEGKAFWVNPVRAVKKTANIDDKAKKQNVSDWFYTPIWKQAANFDYSGLNKKETLLVLADRNSFSDSLINKLKEENNGVEVAFASETYKKVNDGVYLFNPEEAEDYHRLLKEVLLKKEKPNKILNLLGISDLADDDLKKCGENVFYSMMYLAQALGSVEWNSNVNIKVLVNNSQKIFGERDISPEKTLHLGACNVIPKEYPNITCNSVDFVLPVPGSVEEQELVEYLIDEIYCASENGLAAYRGQERFVQVFEKTETNRENGKALPLKYKGVYLITGGLGGIGLNLAQHFALEMKAKLIFTGRTVMPEAAEWDSWLISHGKKDSISQKIRKLKALKELGAEILVCQADVTNKKDMERVKFEAVQKFGRIDGIIHAAGLPGGGMIQMKKKEAADRVLAPKVQGTLTLFEVFKDNRLDFFMYCSSLNAITGGFGQIDYSAANIFLNSFANAHDSRRGTRFVSVAWDRWPGTGMATGIGQTGSINEEEVHPLLGKEIMFTPEKVIYQGQMSPKKDWVLSEHLVMGTPTIAGTTYLDMAKAAFEEVSGSDKAEISDVVFITPMSVNTDEKRDVFTILNKNASNYEFRIISKAHTEDDDKLNWQEHARGKIKECGEAEEKIIDIKEAASLCTKKIIDISKNDEKPSENFISFGKRWRSLKKFSLGENEALVEVELSEEHFNDLEEYKLHPALLDIATGAVRLAAEGNYLPFSYEKLMIKGTLPAKIYGYIRFKNGYTGLPEIAAADIDIIDEQGRQLIEIKNFSMRLINQSAAEGIKTRDTIVKKPIELEGLEKLLKESAKAGIGVLNQGITSSEGVEAFKYILNSCNKSQLVVSTKDIEIAIRESNYIKQAGVNEALEEAAAAIALHPRPELENDYVSPKNDTEKKLAELWQNLLGIDKVGIHDEFFALGGDSLLLIQLHTKLKEMFTTEIAVVDLYKYTTINALAKYFNSSKDEDQKPEFSHVNQRANKQLDLMKLRKQQMLQRRGGL